MSGLYSLISHHYLLKITGIIWLISINQLALATASQIIAVRIYPSPTYMRLTLESNHSLKYKQFALSNPKRAVIDIESIRLNSFLKRMLMKISTKDSLIDFVRVGQLNPQTVRIVFKLKENVKLQLFSLASVSGFKERLVINFYTASATKIYDPLLAFIEEYSQDNIKKYTSIIQNRSKPIIIEGSRPIMITIDPGHGGEDSGAIGKYHTREKDVVLQIARRLKALIKREKNMCAYMTRNEDIFLPLELRVAKARKQRADLFISIHADAFTNRQPKGSSVFALSTKEATSTAASYLARAQNASNLISRISKNSDRYFDHTIFDMIQSVTIIDSLKFGKTVLNKLQNINKLHNNNVEQAGFAVLKAPDIPSILVETAFISNVEEERKLKTARFQQKVAESILEGIKTYLSERE